MKPRQANNRKKVAGTKTGPDNARRSSKNCSVSSGNTVANDRINTARHYSILCNADENSLRADECLVLSEDLTEAEKTVEQLPDVGRILGSRQKATSTRKLRYPDARFIDGRFIALDTTKKPETSGSDE